MSDLDKERQKTETASDLFGEFPETERRWMDVTAHTTRIAREDHDYWVYHGDFRKWGETIGDGTASLVFAVLPSWDRCDRLYADLAMFAARVLKPGGSMLTHFPGFEYFPHELLDPVCPHLEFEGSVYTFETGSKGKTRRCWAWYWDKPLLRFSKGGDESDHYDPADENLGPGGWKRRRRSVPPEFWIKRFSGPGDLIVDPYCRDGDFSLAGDMALAALRLGRKAWICDPDSVPAKTARAKIEEAMKGAAPAPADVAKEGESQ